MAAVSTVHHAPTSPPVTHTGRPNMMAVLSTAKEVRLKPTTAALAAASSLPAAAAPSTPSLGALLNKRFAGVHSARKQLLSPASPDSLYGGEDSDFAASPPQARALPRVATLPRPMLGDLSAGMSRLRTVASASKPPSAPEAGGGGGKGRYARAGGAAGGAAGQPVSLAAAVAASAARRGLPAAEI